MFFFFQAEDGIRDLVRSRGLGDVYKRQRENLATDNCGLAEMKVESLEMQVMRNGEPYGSTLRVPAVPHPMEAVSYTHLTLPTSDLV